MRNISKLAWDNYLSELDIIKCLHKAVSFWLSEEELGWVIYWEVIFKKEIRLCKVEQGYSGIKFHKTERFIKY